MGRYSVLLPSDTLLDFLLKSLAFRPLTVSDWKDDVAYYSYGKICLADSGKTLPLAAEVNFPDGLLRDGCFPLSLLCPQSQQILVGNIVNLHLDLLYQSS